MSALTHFTVSEGVAALAPSAYALFDTSSQTGIVGWPQVVMSRAAPSSRWKKRPATPIRRRWIA